MLRSSLVCIAQSVCVLNLLKVAVLLGVEDKVHLIVIEI